MQVIEVNTAGHKKDFLLLPKQIYSSDANWIQPLDNDIESVFDAAKNKFFKQMLSILFNDSRRLASPFWSLCLSN